MRLFQTKLKNSKQDYVMGSNVKSDDNDDF